MNKAFEWISVSEEMPKEGKSVLTRIDDNDGIRNQARLRKIGNLWFMDESDMYIYYSPTHWLKVNFPD